MKSDLNCELKGAYKVDLYSGGKFVESTDWFDNTITCFGLNYPFVYSFAESFRFLTLGVAPTWGSNTINATKTGLRTPLTGFQVYNSFSGQHAQSGSYIGWEGYEIGGQHNSNFAGSFSSACGTKFTNKGINLYRGWTIPTGAVENGTVVNEPISIESFMVSPSSGLSPSGAKAFSIVDRSVYIPSGFTATVTYQLSLNFLNFQNRAFFSGVQGDKVGGFFDTGRASSGDLGSELPLLSGWSQLSGIYRQILPGLQIVDSLGACIIPAWGDQLEPKYSDCQKLYYYLSPDNSEFAVSPFGWNGISESGAYNSDGLMANYTQFVSRVGGDLNIYGTNEGNWPSDPNRWYYSGDSQSNSSSEVSVAIPSNIRLQNLLSVANYASGYLSVEDYNYQQKGFVSPILSKWPVSFATPGKIGFDTVNYPNYGQRAVYSTYLKRLPNSGLATPTGIGQNPELHYRSRKVTKRALFSPIQSMGTNSRYSSMTLGYLSAAGSIGDLTFQPYIDFTFFDTSGRNADMAHYRMIPDIYLSNRGSGVARVRFDITGDDGRRPEAIQRLYSVYGFMGPGVDKDNPNTPTGIDVNHPMFGGKVYVGTKSYPSGYAFTGVVIDEAVSGNIYENDGTGIGAVYGVVASTGFYESPIDTCLIDYRPWSGKSFVGFGGDFGPSGVYPNETGDYDKLYWPTSGSKMGLGISEIAYHLSGYGLVEDNAGFYDGTKAAIGDINYNDTDYPSLFETGRGGYPTFLFHEDSVGLLRTENLSAFSLTNMLLNNGGGTLVSLPPSTGEAYNGYVTFGGFSFADLATSRCVGLNRSEADIRAYTSDESQIGMNNGNILHLAYTRDNGQSYYVLDTPEKIVVSPTQWCRPTGTIHHVEHVGTSGYRLLPNYAYPNNQGIDSYSPVMGGSYPGMSMENGMQVFCDFLWSGG